MIQIGGVYTTFCQKEGILLQKYRDRNGRCIAILFRSIGVRGRWDTPEFGRPLTRRGCRILSDSMVAGPAARSDNVPEDAFSTN